MVVQRLVISPCPVAATTIFRALETNTVLEEIHISRYSSFDEQGSSQLIASFPRMKSLKRLHLNVDHFKLLIQHASFIPALRQNTSLEELSPLDDSAPWCGTPMYMYKAAVVAAKMLLARNASIRRAKELLALQPRTGRPIGSKSGIWSIGMAQLGSCSSPSAGGQCHFSHFANSASDIGEVAVTTRRCRCCCCCCCWACHGNRQSSRGTKASAPLENGIKQDAPFICYRMSLSVIEFS
jgi:hypothetical protein